MKRRGCMPPQFGMGGIVAAKKIHQEGVTVSIMIHGEISWSTDVDDCLHGAGVFGKRRIRVVARALETEQGCQLRTRRVAECANVVRIDVVLFGIVSKPPTPPLTTAA